jgi:hypothetical protein
MHSSLLKLALTPSSVLLFKNLLILEFLLGASETLLCSMSDPQVKTVFLLVAHQLLILFARGGDVYGAMFSLIIFYEI